MRRSEQNGEGQCGVTQEKAKGRARRTEAGETIHGHHELKPQCSVNDDCKATDRFGRRRTSVGSSSPRTPCSHTLAHIQTHAHDAHRLALCVCQCTVGLFGWELCGRRDVCSEDETAFLKGSIGITHRHCWGGPSPPEPTESAMEGLLSPMRTRVSYHDDDMKNAATLSVKKLSSERHIERCLLGC